jgi:hypothetical protein
MTAGVDLKIKFIQREKPALLAGFSLCISLNYSVRDFVRYSFCSFRVPVTIDIKAVK